MYSYLNTNDFATSIELSPRSAFALVKTRETKVQPSSD